MNEDRVTQSVDHSWNVLSQQETTGQDSAGRYVNGVKITFTTASGLNGTVFIPDAIYNAETARAAIQQRVDSMASVHGLSGGR